MVRALPGELSQAIKTVLLTETHKDLGKKENVNVDHANNFLSCRNNGLFVHLNFDFHSVKYRHKYHNKSGADIECD